MTIKKFARELRIIIVREYLDLVYAITHWGGNTMLGSSDITGGKLKVTFAGSKNRTVSLSADEAYELLDFSKKMKKKRGKAKSLKQYDMMVYSMYDYGIPVPSIAARLDSSQISVEASIKRVESGRYGSDIKQFNNDRY